MDTLQKTIALQKQAIFMVRKLAKLGEFPSEYATTLEKEYEEVIARFNAYLTTEEKREDKET